MKRDGAIQKIKVCRKCLKMFNRNQHIRVEVTGGCEILSSEEIIQWNCFA